MHIKENQIQSKKTNTNKKQIKQIITINERI